MPIYTFTTSNEIYGISSDSDAGSLPVHLGPWKRLSCKDVGRTPDRSSEKVLKVSEEDILDEILKTLDRDLFMELVAFLEKKGCSISFRPDLEPDLDP